MSIRRSISGSLRRSVSGSMRKSKKKEFEE